MSGSLRLPAKQIAGLMTMEEAIKEVVAIAREEEAMVAEEEGQVEAMEAVVEAGEDLQEPAVEEEETMEDHQTTGGNGFDEAAVVFCLKIIYLR